MGKLIRYFAFGILGVGILAAAVAMFAEPFFQELYKRQGIDSAAWVSPLLSVFHYQQTHIVITAMIAAGLGAWANSVATRFDRSRLEKSMAAGSRLAELGDELHSLEHALGNNDWPSLATIERCVSRVMSLELTLNSMGFKTPHISFEADPIGFVVRMREYASTVAPLIADGHTQEAKKKAEQTATRIRSQAPEVAIEQKEAVELTDS